MPQSPAKTESWFFKKGYFTEKEVKIIVNSGTSPYTRRTEVELIISHPR